MSPMASLRTLLLSYPAVSALTTTITAPPLASSTVMPAITIQMITGRELESLDGVSGILRSIMQVNCYATDSEVADQLRRSIKDAILGSRDIIITGSDLTLAAVNHNGDRDQWEDKIRKHCMMVDLQIWWERA